MGKNLKKTKVKLDLITIDIDMTLITEIGVREEYVTLLIIMEKLIKNTGKIMIEIKNHPGA